jgi:hypothetical protein
VITSVMTFVSVTVDVTPVVVVVESVSEVVVVTVVD